MVAGGTNCGGPDGVEIGGASGAALARTLLDPGKMMKGFARFQQFFLMYAKLIMGLSDSNARVSEVTP